MKSHLVFAGAAALLAAAGTSSGALAQAVDLTLIHPFPDSLVFTKSCKELVGKLNATGAVKVAVRGGNEAIPMMNQPNAVRDGIVDMSCIPTAFYAQAIPENDAIATSNTSPDEVRKNGGMALVDKLHGRYMKMKYVGWIDSGIGFYMFMSGAPKLKSDGLPDFTGVKLRDNPIYSAFFKALGASAHNLPATEVYSALEKNVVDAAAWTSIGLMQWKWDKFLKHRVGPEFFQTDMGVIMNLAKWTSLSAAAKAAVEKTVIEHENASRAARMKESAEEQATLKKNGMTFHDLPSEGTKKWHQLSQDAAKERMLSRLKSANRSAEDGEAIWKAYHK